MTGISPSCWPSRSRNRSRSALGRCRSVAWRGYAVDWHVLGGDKVKLSRWCPGRGWHGLYRGRAREYLGLRHGGKLALQGGDAAVFLCKPCRNLCCAFAVEGHGNDGLPHHTQQSCGSCRNDRRDTGSAAGPALVGQGGDVLLFAPSYWLNEINSYYTTTVLIEKVLLIGPNIEKLPYDSHTCHVRSSDTPGLPLPWQSRCARVPPSMEERQAMRSIKRLIRSKSPAPWKYGGMYPEWGKGGSGSFLKAFGQHQVWSFSLTTLSA